MTLLAPPPVSAADHPAAVEDLMPLLHQVPDAHRRFDLPETKAGLSGMTSALLDRLIALGLPWRAGPDGRLFDRYDLDNIALYTGRPSLQRMAMRSWRSALAALDHPRGPPGLVVDYRLDATHQRPRPLTVMTAAHGRVVVDGADTPLWREDIPPPEPRSPTPLPEPVRRLLTEAMAGLCFFMVREGLRWDSAFSRRTGLAECGGAAKLLVRAAREEGFEARHAFGLILAQPYATPHFWTEFHIDGRWIAVDPLLIRVLRATCGLDAARWHEHRSPGGALLRLSEVAGYDPAGRPLLRGTTETGYRLDPIVTAGEEDIPASFCVTVTTAAASERKTDA